MCAMGWLDRLRRSPAQRPFQVDAAAAADSVLHPSSFSLVVFTSDQRDGIPGLLASCGYQILRQGAGSGGPVELMDSLAGVSGPDRNVVLKAYWASSNLTVLIDPEMIVSSAQDQQLVDFCRERGTTAWAALWERVSETAMLTEVAGDGVLRRTWYERGAPCGEQLDPRLEIAESPDGAGVRAAMAAAGVPPDQVFSNVDVTVLELQE
jgi:hypothetical protein